MAGVLLIRTPVSRQSALEETFFLGLRLTAGVDLAGLKPELGAEALGTLMPLVTQAVEDGLLQLRNNSIRLTPRGRLLSNEVFQRFLSVSQKSF